MTIPCAYGPEPATCCSSVRKQCRLRGARHSAGCCQAGSRHTAARRTVYRHGLLGSRRRRRTRRRLLLRFLDRAHRSLHRHGAAAAGCAGLLPRIHRVEHEPARDDPAGRYPLRLRGVRGHQSVPRVHVAAANDERRGRVPDATRNLGPMVPVRTRALQLWPDLGRDPGIDHPQRDRAAGAPPRLADPRGGLPGTPVNDARL